MGSGGFLFRGVPTTTRLEVVVLRDVGSCLGYIADVGMNVGGYGTRKSCKSVIFMK